MTVLKKNSALEELTTVTEDDEITIRDVSDTTNQATGESKRATVKNFLLGNEAVQELGNTSVVSGTNTVTVSLISDQEDTDYRISANLVNIIDNPPSFYNYITSAVTVSGFTTLFDNDMDSDNYSLDWQILR